MEDSFCHMTYTAAGWQEWLVTPTPSHLLQPLPLPVPSLSPLQQGDQTSEHGISELPRMQKQIPPRPLRPRPDMGPVLLLPHSVGQSKTQGTGGVDSPC